MDPAPTEGRTPLSPGKNASVQGVALPQILLPVEGGRAYLECRNKRTDLGRGKWARRTWSCSKADGSSLFLRALGRHLRERIRWQRCLEVAGIGRRVLFGALGVPKEARGSEGGGVVPLEMRCVRVCVWRATRQSRRLNPSAGSTPPRHTCCPRALPPETSRSFWALLLTRITHPSGGVCFLLSAPTPTSGRRHSRGEARGVEDCGAPH